MYTCKHFYVLLWTFQEILTKKSERLKDIQEFLNNDRTPEEWSLLYLQKYLEGSPGADEHCRKMLKDGFFLDHVTLLYNPKKAIFKSESKDAKFFRTEIEEFFDHLEMTQVTKRETLANFQKKLLRKYEKSLKCRGYYLYMANCLESIKLEEWSGNWLILDIRQFIDELIKSYQNETNIDLKDLEEDEQETHANYAFLCVLYYLVTKELDDWSCISQIPFSSNIQRINKFCQDLKEK